MSKDCNKYEIVNFVKGFTIGYFLTDFIFSLFKPRKK